MEKLKKQTEKEAAREALLKYVKRGDTVYTILRRVSKSGMSRLIDLYVARDGELLRLTWSAAVLCGYTYDRRAEALRVNGGGMDMGFDVVYNLDRALFSDSKALTQRWL